MFKYRQIYRKIKKYDTIVLARHVGADPDALGSTFGLKASILATFPKKKVYVIGAGSSKFRYLGLVDKLPEDTTHALLIVLDTPDKKRVDGIENQEFAFKIKIDHHPYVESFCDIEWMDDTASSASQLVMELIFHTRLKMTREVASKLFIGLVADTERFLYAYTTPKTFKMVAKMISDTKLDFTLLYANLYQRPLREIRFQGYLMQNMIVTEHGFGYVKIDEETLEKYKVDAATAGNMINNFNYIEEVIAWGFFSTDKGNGNIRGSIRSRGPIINETAASFGGGGHAFASGVKLPDFETVDELIKALDAVCKKYKEEEKDRK